MTDETANTQNEAVDATPRPKAVKLFDEQADFPTLARSRKGGYVEEQVDEWILNVFRSSNKLIERYNKAVAYAFELKQDNEAKQAQIDAFDQLKAQEISQAVATAVEEHDETAQNHYTSLREQAQAHIDTIEEAHEAEVRELRAALAAAQESSNVIAPVQVEADDNETVEAEEAPAVEVAPAYSSVDDDFAEQGAKLLTEARDTAARFVQDARSNAARVLEEAETESARIQLEAHTRVEDLKSEAEKLETGKAAVLGKLIEFHRAQLEAIEADGGAGYDPADTL